MKAYENILSKFGNLLGWIFIIFYTFLWISAAFGVFYIIFMLFKTAILGWFQIEGFRRYYLLCGSITVVIAVFKVIPGIFNAGLDLFRDNPFELLVASAILGCIPILLIPLITVGWPIVWYLTFRSLIDKRRENKTTT